MDRTGFQAKPNSDSIVIGLISKPALFYVVLLCAVILTTGFIYAVYLGSNLRFSDEDAYYLLTTNLLERGIFSADGVNATAAKPPGYVFFLGLLGSLNGGIFVFRYANFILLAATIYLIYRLGVRLSGPLAGVLAAFMVAGYGVLFYTASTLYPQTLAGFLFVAVMYLLARVDELSLWETALLGVLFAWLILTVLTFIFALVIIALWLLFRPGLALRRKLGMLALMLAIVGLAVGLWSYRNYLLFDRFVFISTQGDAFLAGNAPHTHPTDGPITDISVYDTAEIKRMNEADRDAYFRSQAMAFITGQPLDWLRLYLGKVVNHFQIDNRLGTVTEERPLNTLIMTVTYGPLLLIFLTRLILIHRSRPSYFELLLIVLYFAAAFYTALVFTRIRYRLAYDLLLILVVAVFIAQFEAPVRRFMQERLRW